MFQAQTETHDTLPTFFSKIQLALALKTKLCVCVCMYLPYICVYKTTNVHTVVFMEFETFETGFYPKISEREQE